MQNGTWREYYENGDLKASGNYFNDLEDGKWVNFYRNNKLQQEEEWNKGKLVELGDFLAQDGSKLDKGTFKNGSGTKKSYSENGILVAEGEFKEGLPNGVWTYYHENSKISGKGKMFNGLREGSWSYYFPDGKVQAEGKYVNDEVSGFWKFYSEDGSPKEEKNFDIDEEID